MVFVWAFQRRRYRVPLRHDPLIGRVVLRHPESAYVLPTLLLPGRAVYLGYRPDVRGFFVMVGANLALLQVAVPDLSQLQHRAEEIDGLNLRAFDVAPLPERNLLDYFGR
jgi:hypothetical protein